MKDNDKNILIQLRYVQLELLDEFVRLCEENNLAYFLTGGTLLGAIRHKGFIPWDDDIDVAMPRRDYELFLDSFEKTKKNKYYTLSYRTNNKAADYCKHFIKFCKSGTVFAESYKKADGYAGIFIDIFPLDNSISFLSIIQFNIIKIIHILCRIKSNAIITKKKRKLFIGRIICSLFSKNFLNNVYRNLFLIFKDKKTKYLTFFSGIYGYKRETHKYDVIFPFSKVLFEGKQYSAPNDCDSFLKTLYGNYMELPPVEKRHTHSPEYISFNDTET